MILFRCFDWIVQLSSALEEAPSRSATRLCSRKQQEEDLSPADTVLLPQDVVVLEILSRLPAEDVLKCRTVCKEWKFIISTPCFVETQAARAPSVIVLQNYLGSGNVSFHLLDLGSTENPRIERVQASELLFVESYHQARLVGSCNGLLLLRMPEVLFPCLAIRNPLTGRGIFLKPGTRVERYCGFFFHPLKKKYKLLVASLAEPVEARLSYHYRVLNFQATSNQWYLSERDESTLVGTYNSVPTDDPAININGSLHWMLAGRVSRKGCIMVFNTEREKLEFRDGPECCSGCRFISRHSTSTTGMRLLQMGEMLAFSHVDFEFVDLWTLREYGNWRWARRYRVSLKQELGFYPHHTLIEPSSIQDRELLLIWYDVGMFSFNLETRLLRKLDMVGVPRMEWDGSETIVSTSCAECLAALDHSLAYLPGFDLFQEE